LRGDSGDTSGGEGGAAGHFVSEPAAVQFAAGKTEQVIANTPIKGVHAIANLESDAAFLTVPDAHLLFSAEFKRSGPDLTLVGPNGQKFIIFDYFRYEKQPDLVSPDGATLAAKLVETLARPLAPNQYAQATAPGPSGQVIGKVEKITGSVTAVRNGVAVSLNVGDALDKNDVIQTGSDSTVGISLLDGTALNLSANTRMALNEFIFDVNATTGNGGHLSLVQGAFALVSGLVATTGGLNIETPVANIGIRGTVLAASCADAGRCEYSASTEITGPKAGQPSTFSLETGGTYDASGHYVGGTAIGSVTVGANIAVAAAGVGLPVQVTSLPATQTNPELSSLTNQLTQSYPQFTPPPVPAPQGPPAPQTTTPQSTTSPSGSSTLPLPAPLPPPPPPPPPDNGNPDNLLPLASVLPPPPPPPPPPPTVITLPPPPPPPPTETISPTIVTDSGQTSTIPSGGLTKDNTPTFSGTGQAGATVTLYDTDGTTVLGTATVDNSGNWTITSSTLSDGTHSLTAVGTDTSGNTVTAGPVTAIIDTTPPTAPTISLVTDNVSPVTGALANGASTNDTDLTVKVNVSGTGAVAGDTIQLYDGSSPLGSAYTLTQTDINNGFANVQTGTLSDGTTYTITATITDAAGNQSAPSSSFTVIEDTTPPAAGTLSFTNLTDTGTANTPPVTQNNTFDLTLSGAEAGALVEYQVSTNGGLNWTPTTVSQISLTDGDYRFRAVVTDAAGNSSTTTAIEVIVDATPPPAVATVMALSSDTGTAGDFITTVASQTVSGTFTGALGAGEKIQVSADGTTWVDATAGAGTWLASGVTLSSGTGTLSVRTIDAAGNTTAGTGHSYTLDTVAPVVTDSAGTTAWTEASGLGASTAVVIDSGATVADADNTTLASATVSITGNFASGQDVLSFVNDNSTMGNIAGSYDSVTGVLTLTSAGATATLAQWQAALDAVTYNNLSHNPTGMSRTISFTVNDGTQDSAVSTKTVSITAVDTPPVLTVAANASYTANGPAATLSSTAMVSDVDNQDLQSATVKISSGFFTGDVLSAVTTGTSITASYDATTGVLTLTGNDTLAHYQQVLDSVTYSSTSTNPTNFGSDNSRTISWVVNDGTLPSTTQTTTLSITAQDAAPTLTATASNPTFTEGSAHTQGLAVGVFSGTSISTIEAGQTITGLTFTVSGLKDGANETVTVDGTTFNLTDGTTGTTSVNGLTYSVSVSGSTATVTLTSASGISTTAAQTVVNGITYQDTQVDDPTAGTRTFTLTQIVDSGSNTSPNVNTTTLSIASTVTVTPINDAPTLNNVAATAAYTKLQPPVTMSPGMAVSDVDNTTLASATVTIASGFQSGDTLTINGTTSGQIVNGANTIQYTYDSSTHTMSLSGTDTVGDYQAALRLVSFSNATNNDPTAGGTDNSRTIIWVANDGTANSATQTTIVSILPSSTAYVWGTTNFLGPAVSGTHIYSPSVAVNPNENVVAALYGVTSSNYNPNGPDNVSLIVAALDPFFLSTNQQAVIIDSTVQQFPSPYFLQVPNTSSTDAEGIVIYQTEDSSGNRSLNEAFITGNNNTLNASGAIQIAGLLYPTENPLFLQVHGGPSGLTSYAVAFDQYDQKDGIYTINLETFVHNSGDPNYDNSSDFTASGVVTALTLTGLTGGPTTLPASFFNTVNPGSGSSGVYMLAYAEADAPHLGQDYIKLLSYTETGELNTSFGPNNQGYVEIAPDLSAYGNNPSLIHNQITLEAKNGTNTGNPTSLFFIQPNDSGPLFVAWNETVTVDGNPNTYDQVEFVRHLRGGVGPVDQYFTFQIPDGQAQNVKLQWHNYNGGTMVELAYGDSTSTTVVEFFYDPVTGTTTQVGTYTEATPHGQTYSGFRDLGDGRVAIIYDDQINSDGTTQATTNIVDFRTTGIYIDNSGLPGGKEQYVAGTHFNDTFIGGNNGGNEYYFIGQNSAVGPAPTDTFTGGQFANNVAIFPDAISNYTFTWGPTGSLTVTNTGDPLHAGSLTLTGMQSPFSQSGVYVPSVQALAFGPTKDPRQNGMLEASAGTLYITGPLYNPVVIDSGAVLEFGAPNNTGALNNTNGSLGVSSTFLDTGGTLKLDAAAQNTPTQPSNFTGQIILDGRVNGPTSTDIIDLANASVSSASLAGNTLTVTLTGGATVTYNVVGGTPGTIATSSDGAGGTDLLLKPVGSLWGSFTSESITGGHLYSPVVNVQGSVAAIVFGETSSGYVPGGPDSITLNLALLDPFGLGYASGTLPLATYTIQDLPGKYNVILPTGSTGQQEAIVIYETQDSNGTPTLNQIVETETGGPNGSFSPTTPSPIQIETGLTATIEKLSTSFDVTSSSNPTLTSYSVAWDQYNASSGTYQVDFQIFNPPGSATVTASPVEQVINVTSGVTSLGLAPAWFFRSGGFGPTNGGGTGGTPYALAFEQADTQNAGQNDVAFQGYNTTGAPNVVNFLITPDLSYYGFLQGAATNQITQEVNINDGSAQQALAFAPYNAGSVELYAVAWNETVYNGQTQNAQTQIGDQVEFAIFTPNTTSNGTPTGTPVTGHLIKQVTFQTDGNPQKVGVQTFSFNGQSYEVLVYGDSTATHIIEFDAAGNEIASIVDPSTTVFSQFAVTNDGRVAVTYTVNGGVTSQITTNVFDLRTTGWNIPTSVSGAQDAYFAGTQFNDTIHGRNGVNNFYYFVGASTPVSVPSDFFYGGTSGWNEVLFPDAISNYSLQTNGSGGYIVTNTGDPQHTGSVTVDNNVQALLFNPSGDPAPVSGAVDVANGSALVVLQATALNVTFANTNGVDNGELVLYDSAGFTGQISGFAGGGSISNSDVIDLADLAFTSGQMTVQPPLVSNGISTVTISNNQTGQSDVLHLTGDYSASTWILTPDGHGGTNLVDPPAGSGSITIDSGAMLNIAAASAATVTFGNNSDTTGELILNDSKEFTGNIVGFKGDGTLSGSDQIDLSDINYNSGSFTDSYSNGILTVSDGTNTANLHFTGTYSLDNFKFASDGNGGTIVYDPPTASAQTTTEPATVDNDVSQDGISVINPAAAPSGTTITASSADQTQTGAGSNDTFAFAPGFGHDTITNFQPTTDVLQIDHSVALLAATQDDGHGNVVITAGPHDTITLQHVTLTQLQAHQGDFHII
jgi:hypothetical protein